MTEKKYDEDPNLICIDPEDDLYMHVDDALNGVNDAIVAYMRGNENIQLSVTKIELDEIYDVAVHPDSFFSSINIEPKVIYDGREYRDTLSGREILRFYYKNDYCKLYINGNYVEPEAIKF